MNRTQKRADKAKLRKIKSKAVKLAKSQSGSGKLFAVLDERVRELAKTAVTLYQNQQRLAKSYDGLAEASDSLDEQFAVLSRLVIGHMNKLTDAFNTVTGGMPAGAPRVEPLGRDIVTKMFADWREFKKRPDFRDHNTAWFMGEDLSKLPPPPAKEEEKAPSAAQGDPSGAEVFGGDYGKSDDRDAAGVEAGPQGATADAANPVSEMRKPDAAQG
jgi:hypothetical protein